MSNSGLKFSGVLGVTTGVLAGLFACAPKTSSPADSGAIVTPYDAGGNTPYDAGGYTPYDAGVYDAGSGVIDAGGTVVSSVCTPDGGGGETDPDCDIVGLGQIGFCGICASYPDGGFLQINGRAQGEGYSITKNPAIAIWCVPGEGLQAQNCYPSKTCGFVDQDNGFYCISGACSASAPSGTCAGDAGYVCTDGGCGPPPACSISAPTGTCDAGQFCVDAGCAKGNLCGSCTIDGDCIGAATSGYTPGRVYCRPLVDAGGVDAGFVAGNCSDGGTCYCLQDCNGVACSTNYTCNGAANSDCIPTNMNCPLTADAG